MTKSETVPLVSIGMPVYNGERFIRKALDSLLAQNFKDFELIISDNASEDATQQICFEYASKDSRIRYYRNEINLGAIENSRNVLELSSGKYFMFAADHDLYEPNFISRCVEILEKDSSVVLCYPKTAWIDTDGNFLEVIPGHFDTRGLKQISRFNVTLWRLGYCYQFYGLMRLEIFRQTNTYEGVVTPGLVILAAFAIIIWKKKRWRFAAVVLVLFLLSLGPELRIFGRPLGIPLPFRLMQSIPVLNGIRAPSRFAILGGIFAAVGAGMAFSMMKDRLRALLMFLLLFELTVLTLPCLLPEIPEVCYDISCESTILEVPCDRNVRRYALFQTASGYSRQYTHLSRLPDFLADIPEFPEIPDNTDVIIYHRWLFEGTDRDFYDSIYTQYFPGFTEDDSVWILDRTRTP